MIKKLIPYPIKLRIHLLMRRLKDIVSGHYFKYARSTNGKDNLPKALNLRQELKPNEAKKINLSLAINVIESVLMRPNEIFSFWRIVGHPSKRNGFVESRSLVNGKVEKSFGGGLCQLSGLIYHLSLLAGLEILERHNHSIDIYTEETRFAPLGSDATVAYGYKDLRIRNNFKSPIQFQFLMTDQYLTISLTHTTPLKKDKVEFIESALSDHTKEITTIVNGKATHKSVYKTLY